MSILLRFFVGTLLILVSSVSFAWEKDYSYKLRVLFLNDTHGRFWKNSDGEGGYSAISTLSTQLRNEGLKEGFYTFLLHAGDVNTGVPESDLLDAEPDFVALDYLEVDAMAIGNHEFDKPIEVLKKQIGWASFPILSANIVSDNVYTANIPEGVPAVDYVVYKPYTLRSVNGLRIAILGLTTEDTPLLTLPDNHKGVHFEPAVESAKKWVPYLRQNNDFVIALTHIGFYDGGNYGTSAPGDNALAESVAGINLIVGGHSHTELGEPLIINDTIITQAGGYTQYLGKIDIEFINGKSNVVDYQLYPINLLESVVIDGEKKKVLVADKIEEDPILLSLLGAYQAQGEESLNVSVGSIDGVLVGERNIVRSSETNLGNLLAEIMAKALKADIGIMNSGGIRADLKEGAVSYRDILTVQPFGNTIVAADLTGSQLKEYLQIAATKTPGSGGYPQFYGVKVVLQGDQLESVEVAGQPIDDNATYRIATNNFIASGGDGYMPINELSSYVDSGLVDAGLLKSFFEQQGEVRVADYAPEGRFIRK